MTLIAYQPEISRAFFGIGHLELLLILVIILVVFGAGKLPGAGEALGKSIRNFKTAMKGDQEKDAEKKDEKKDTPPSNSSK